MTHWQLDIAPAESAIEAIRSGLPTISVDERATRRWFFHVVDWPDGGRSYTGHSILNCLAEISRRGFTRCNLVSPEYTHLVFRLELVESAQTLREM